MTGYTEPRIFRSNKQGQFTKFLIKHWETPFEEHLASETDRLQAIFEAVSQTLMPFALRNRDRARLTTQNIARTFYDVGVGNGTVVFGMPLIIPEQNFLYPTQAQVFHETSYQQTDAKHLKPDGYKRMFWTSAFGLLRIKNNEASNDNTYVFPTNTVPQEFLDIEGIDPVIKAAAKLSAVVNHDYFHQIMYASISADLDHRSPEAPINKYFCDGQGKLGEAWSKGTLDSQFKTNAWYLENWSMRFQTEVMQTMAQNPDNVLEKAIDEYCKAVENCPALLKAKGTMSSPPISAQDYATRLLAFTLIRALPSDHPCTERSIDKIAASLSASKNPDSKGVRAIFDHMYSSGYTKILFGDGKYGGADSKCETPEEYSEKIKKLSAHSVVLAQRDCAMAFRLQAAQEHRIANQNSVRQRRIKHKNQLDLQEILDEVHPGL